MRSLWLARRASGPAGDAWQGEAGGLGFGYEFSDGALAGDDGLARRQVALVDATADTPQIVQPFDDGGPWNAWLADTLHSIRQAIAARDAPASDRLN